jgi:hypothetical protein
MATIILVSHDEETHNVNEWALLSIGQKLKSTVNVVGIVIYYQFEISLNSFYLRIWFSFSEWPFQMHTVK